MVLEQFSYDAIVGAINSHAEVRPYDWLLLSVTLFGVLLSFIVLWRQTGIMKQQNKIALFEKRYKYFSIYRQLSLNISILDEVFEKINNSDKDYIFIRKVIFSTLLYLIHENNEEDNLCKTNLHSYLTLQVKDLVMCLTEINFLFNLTKIESENMQVMVEHLMSILLYNDEDLINTSKRDEFFKKIITIQEDDKKFALTKSLMRHLYIV